MQRIGPFQQVAPFLSALYRQWLSKSLFLLGLGSTAATYVSSYLAGFAVPRWLPVVFFAAAFMWGLFDVFRGQADEIERLKRENAEHESAEVIRLKNENSSLTSRIAALGGDARTKKAKLLADLISELEGNLRTAQSFYSGPPGNRVYLPPSIDCWKQERNELSFLDLGIRNELKEIYGQIERWRGIVASGLSPSIGSPEISEITQAVKRELPYLVPKLKAVQGEVLR